MRESMGDMNESEEKIPKIRGGGNFFIHFPIGNWGHGKRELSKKAN
jgi:hypothetical protein